MRATGVSSSASWSMLARSADCQSWPISASTSRETALNGSCPWLHGGADRVLDPARGVEVRAIGGASCGYWTAGCWVICGRGGGAVETTCVLTARSCSVRFSLLARAATASRRSSRRRRRGCAADVLEQDVAPERGLEGDRPPVVAHDAHARGLPGRASGRCSGPCALIVRHDVGDREHRPQQQPHAAPRRRSSPPNGSAMKIEAMIATTDRAQMIRKSSSVAPTRGHHSARYGRSSCGSVISQLYPLRGATTARCPARRRRSRSGRSRPAAPSGR